MAQSNWSPSQAISFGWTEFKKQSWFLIGTSLIMMVIGMAPSVFWRGRSAIRTLVGWVVSLIATIGVIKISLKIYAGQKVDFDEFFQLKKQEFFSVLGASLLYMLLVIVGLIFLVIPGVYIMLRLQFMTFLVIDKKMTVDEALKASWRLTQDQTWPLFVLWLMILGLTIFGFLLLGVGLLIAIPICFLAQVYAYKQLAK